jgi:hypothetical protein
MNMAQATGHAYALLADGSTVQIRPAGPADQQSIVFGREPSRGSRHGCAHYGDGFAVSTGWPRSAGAWYARLPETGIQPRRIRKSASRSGRRWLLSFRNLD